MNLTRNTLDPERLPPMLTVEQYAGLLQLRPPAVRAQLRAGQIIGQKAGPRLWRIPRSEVEKIFNQQEAAHA